MSKQNTMPSDSLPINFKQMHERKLYLQMSFLLISFSKGYRWDSNNGSYLSIVFNLIGIGLILISRTFYYMPLTYGNAFVSFNSFNTKLYYINV